MDTLQAHERYSTSTGRENASAKSLGKEIEDLKKNQAELKNAINEIFR